MNDIVTTEKIDKLRKDLNFPEKQMSIAVRAKFCCEYCGKNLLESIDAYDSWQIDHILPDDGDLEENLALSCKLCNFSKRHSVTETLKNAANRGEKIKEARDIVWERRARKETTLIKVKEFAHLLLINNENTYNK